MEVVQKRMEIMSGELNQMRRTKLLSQDNCTQILKMRKHFEYKINGIAKNRQDFIDYIEYEKSLLKMIKQRRNTMKISEKMGDIEHKIMNRVKELYETTIHRFPDDTTLCLAYFKFCKQANYINAASVAISNMLKNHSHNVEIWLVAAKWYAYDRNEISTSLKIICKGLTKHKDSKLLYTEVIQLEIQNALSYNMKVNGDNSGLIDQQQNLCLEKLETYIREVISNIDNCEYYIELLDYLTEYTFTVPVQAKIIQHLTLEYSLKALTWNLLAQRDWKGLNGTSDVDGTSACGTKSRLDKCRERYKQGLDIVSGEEKEHLWSLYINCMIDARQEDHGVGIALKTTYLKEALQQASNEGYLCEKYYMQWLDLADGQEKIDILRKGIEKIPQSVELWKVYMRTQILSNNEEVINSVFRAGIRALKEKALPLWTAVIRYNLLCLDKQNVIEKLYKRGVTQPQEVSDVLKPQFLEWLAVTKGMCYTRGIYADLAKQEPYCKELHVTMAKLESTEIDFNFQTWDLVYELACEQFGKEDVDVWLSRIQYYIDYKLHKVSKDDLQRIYSNAEKSLPEVLFLSFKDKYYAMTNK